MSSDRELGAVAISSSTADSESDAFAIEHPERSWYEVKPAAMRKAINYVTNGVRAKPKAKLYAQLMHQLTVGVHDLQQLTLTLFLLIYRRATRSFILVFGQRTVYESEN